MKKLFILMIFTMLTMVNFDFRPSNALIADVQEYTGIEIDETEYTDFITYDEAEKTHSNPFGTSIAYVKFVAAAAKHLDSDTYVVINYAETDALDSLLINMYHGWIQFYSDADSSYTLIPYGYGTYVSSEDFEMTQPTPTTANDFTTYSVGVDISATEPPVFGTVANITKSAMEISDNHSYAYERFNPRFDYSCTGFGNFNCNFRNASQTNKGSFKVDTSNATFGPNRGAFINESKVKYYFRNTSGVEWVNSSLSIELIIVTAP